MRWFNENRSCIEMKNYGVILPKGVYCLMKTEVVLKSEKRLDNHIWNLFNENRSCIEI